MIDRLVRRTVAWGILLGICLLFTPTTAGQMTGHWQLNEGSGTVFADTSGNMNDGYLPQLSKLPEWSTDTPPTSFGNPYSLKFDPSARNLVDTTFEGIGGNTARTISAWMKTDSTSGQSIVSYGARDANGRKWHFRVNPDGAPRIPGAVRTEAQGGNQTGSTDLADGLWHHVVSVFPGGDGGDNADVRHYVDGVLDTPTGTTDEPINTGIGGDFPRVSIGARRQSPPAVENFMDGWIDDVRMYDRELSEAEIQGLVTEPTIQGMVAHWSFDDGPGNTTAGETVAQNDGVLISDITDPAIAWSDDAPSTPFGQTSSVAFNGSDSYIQTDFAGIGGGDWRSVAFWVRTEDLATHGLVAWGDSTANGEKYHIRVNDSEANGPLGAIRTEVQGGYIVGSANIADGQWHHIAAVLPDDGSPNVEDVLHYVDGVLDTTGGVNPFEINTDIVDGQPLTIGRRTQGSVQDYFNGQLADVRVYDFALTANQVAALVPEPSSLLLVALGLFGLAAYFRRPRLDSSSVTVRKA